MQKEHNSSKSTFKYIVFISFLICFAKILGVLKQIIIASAFGANATTDIYFAADGFTSTLAQILSTAILPAVVTEYIYVKNKYNDGDIRSKRVIRQAFSFFAIIGFLLTLLSILLSPFIAKLVGISFSENEQKTLTFFIIGLSPAILVSSINAVAQGYLNANNNYIPGKTLGLFYSVFTIICIFLLKDYFGVVSMVIGFLAGYLLHTIFILFFIRKKVPLFGGNFLKNPDFRHLMLTFLPILISVSIVDIGHLIDRIVASSLPEGNLSILNYAQVLSTDLVNAIIITAVGTVLLTSYSNKLSVIRNLEETKNDINHAILHLSFFIVLISALYYIEGQDLIDALLKRGNFSDNNAFSTYSVVIYYVCGFEFMAINEVLIKIHYSFQNTKAPLINSAIGVGLNVVLSVLFSKAFGLKGIALATSVSLFVIMVLSLITIRKHIKSTLFKSTTIFDFSKTVIAAVITARLGLIIKNGLNGASPVAVLLVVGFSMTSIYLFVNICLNQKTMSTFFDYVKKRFAKQNN